MLVSTQSGQKEKKKDELEYRQKLQNSLDLLQQSKQKKSKEK